MQFPHSSTQQILSVARQRCSLPRGSRQGPPELPGPALLPNIGACSCPRHPWAQGALVSRRSALPARLAGAQPGLPEADVHPFSPRPLPRRADWLLSFVYRTSSVRLRVAGLQPVLLQDRRVENVDLSSVVSTPCPLGPTLGGGEGAHLTPAQRPTSQGHWPRPGPPHTREIIRTHLGRGNSCSQAPSLCQGNAPGPWHTSSLTCTWSQGQASLSPFHRLGN